MNRIFFLLVGMLVVWAQGYSQHVSFPHPELEWQTIETDHFLIHFHNGSERTARESARIAEAVYKPITELYRHAPDQKVSIVIRDHDDYSNGAAYFYDNKIEIWASSMDFELRGIHPWLQNVIAHEFTHIVQIQTAMKLGRKIPAIYLQWFGYESERRPDVLYGFPNALVSYPFSAFVVPSWFAEGVAQVNHPDLRVDYWDSHRDMILRMYMLDDNPLSWEEMAVFGKTSLGNESSYNAGFSIVEYIAEKYGVPPLEAISRELGKPTRVTIDGAVQSVLGKSGSELFEEWKAERTTSYSNRVSEVRKNLREGRTIEPEGFGNFYPAFTSDGNRIAYVSNKGKDYFSQSSVYIMDLKTGQLEKVRDGIRSTLSFSRDGKSLYYSRITSDNAFHSRFADLYRLDLDAKKEKRLTHGARSLNPRLSADGTQLAFTVGSDGTRNLAISDVEGKNMKMVTRFQNGEQVYMPAWSPDSRFIAFAFSESHGQRVAVMDLEKGEANLLDLEGDARDPFFSPSGNLLYFSHDRDGIFNIFSLDLTTLELRQITNVLGGAFVPSVNEQGEIAYSKYTSRGYQIALLEDSDKHIFDPVATCSLYPLDLNVGTELDHIAVDDQGATKDRSFSTDAGKISWTTRPYRNTFSSLTLVPVVRVDNYNPRNKGIDIIKGGLYFGSFEMLDKLQLFGTAVINRKAERDLYLGIEYGGRVPLLYNLGLDPTLGLEIFNVSRTTDFSFNLFVDRERTFSAEVTFSLLGIDFSLKQPLKSEKNLLTLRYSYQRYIQDFGTWIHPTFGVIRSSRAIYLIGHAFDATWRLNGIEPSVDQAIAPVGRSISLSATYEMNQFNPEDDFKIENGFRVPLYTQYDYPRVQLRWSEHLPLPLRHHTLSFELQAGSILGPAVDDFFDFYAGGFVGMKGYPFYSLGGNEMAALHAAYRFPITRSLDFRFLQFYFTKLYGSVFGDFGNAWMGETPALRNWKKDAGLELRLEAFSFYSYPTRFFVSGAYGFDRFSKTVNNVTVTYGREWNFYLGILFGFEIRELVVPRFR